MHLEADAVPEAEVEAPRERLAGRPGPLRRVAGLLEDVRCDVVQLATGAPGPDGGARRVEGDADESWRPTTSSLGSPTTNVRVMSAQQPLASSQGQRSIVIGRAAGSGPLPGS